MGRGQTTDEFAAANGPHWAHFGGLPGDPGIVTDEARKYGNLYGVDAEALDAAAESDGWEFHDQGYDGKVRHLAEHWPPGE